MRKTGWGPRANYDVTNYDTNVTDEQWNRVRAVLPHGNKGGRGRPRRLDLREVINGMMYWLKKNVPLRSIPEDLPPWGTVWYYVYSWHNSGILDNIVQALGDKEVARILPKKLKRISSHDEEEKRKHYRKIEKSYQGNYQQIADWARNLRHKYEN